MSVERQSPSESLVRIACHVRRDRPPRPPVRRPPCPGSSSATSRASRSCSVGASARCSQWTPQIVHLAPCRMAMPGNRGHRRRRHIVPGSCSRTCPSNWPEKPPNVQSFNSPPPPASQAHPRRVPKAARPLPPCRNAGRRDTADRTRTGARGGRSGFTGRGLRQIAAIDVDLGQISHFIKKLKEKFPELSAIIVFLYFWSHAGSQS